MIGMRQPVAGWQAWAISTGLGALAAAWALTCLARNIKPRVVVAGMMMLMVTDLAIVNASLLDPRPLESVIESPGFLSVTVADKLQQGRIFSPSYSVPQHVAAAEGIELADGVNPLQLALYRDFMANATGFSAEAYSVTLPPFPSGDPADDWAPQIDARQLGMLNISWVASAFEFEAEDLLLVREDDGVYLYRNAAVRPRAWIEDPAPASSSWTEVNIIDWSPNRIILGATGPGKLVLSEILYPGWTAEIDGERVEIVAAHDVLRSVDLPPGRHEVIFCFHGWTVLAGAILTLLTLLALAVMRWRR
jgi:hypothetical protein